MDADLDPLLHFAITELDARELINVEYGFDGNDPYVTFKCDGNTSMKTCAQMNAGKAATWTNTSQDLTKLVVMQFAIPASKFLISNRDALPPSVSFGVWDWNQMRAHVAIGQCSCPLPAALGSLAMGDTYPMELELTLAGKSTVRGRLKVIIKRVEASAVKASHHVKYQSVPRRLSSVRSIKPAPEVGKDGPALLGPAIAISQGLVKEIIEVACNRTPKGIDNLDTQHEFKSSLICMLHHASHGKWSIVDNDIIQQSRRPWKWHIVVNDNDMLGPLEALLHTAAFVTLTVRGTPCTVRIHELNPTMRSDSMLESIKNFLSAPEMPPSAELSAIQLYQCISRMNPRRINRMPLKPDTVKDLLTQMNMHRNKVNAAVDTALDGALYSEAASPAPSIGCLHRMFSFTQQIFDELGLFKDNLPTWLFVAEETESRRAVDVDDHILELLNLFDKTLNADESVSKTCLLLLLHFRILIAFKKTSNATEVEKHLTDLEGYLKADVDIFGQSCLEMLARVRSQMTLALNGDSNNDDNDNVQYSVWKDTARGLLETIRPFDLSQWQRSMTYLQDNNSEVAEADIVVKLGLSSALSSSAPAPASTKSVPSASTKPLESVQGKVRIYLGSESIPDVDGMMVKKDRLEEHCSKFVFEDNNRDAYFNCVLQHADVLGFQVRIEQRDSHMEIQLISLQLVSRLREQIKHYSQQLRKSMLALVGLADNVTNDDIKWIVFLLKCLSKAKLALNNDSITTLVDEELQFFGFQVASWKVAVTQALTNNRNFDASLTSMLLPLCCLSVIDNLGDDYAVIFAENAAVSPFQSAVSSILDWQNYLARLSEDAESASLACKSLDTMVQLVELFQSSADMGNDIIGLEGRDSFCCAAKKFPRLQHDLLTPPNKETPSFTTQLTNKLDNCRITICEKLLRTGSEYLDNRDVLQCLAYRNELVTMQQFWATRDSTYAKMFAEDVLEFDADLLRAILDGIQSIATKYTLHDWRTLSKTQIEQNCEDLQCVFVHFVPTLYKFGVNEIDKDKSITKKIHDLHEKLLDKISLSAMGILSVTRDSELPLSPSFFFDIFIAEKLHNAIRNANIEQQPSGASFQGAMDHLATLVATWSSTFCELHTALTTCADIEALASRMVIIMAEIVRIAEAAPSSPVLVAAPEILTHHIFNFCSSTMKILASSSSSSDLDLANVVTCASLWKRVRAAKMLLDKFPSLSLLLEQGSAQCMEFNNKCVQLFRVFCSELNTQEPIALRSMRRFCLLQLLVQPSWVTVESDREAVLVATIETYSEMKQQYRTHFSNKGNEFDILCKTVLDFNAAVNKHTELHKLLEIVADALAFDGEYEQLQTLGSLFYCDDTSKFSKFAREVFHNLSSEFMQNLQKQFKSCIRNLFEIHQSRSSKILHQLLLQQGVANNELSECTGIPTCNPQQANSNQFEDVTVADLSRIIGILDSVIVMANKFGNAKFSSLVTVALQIIVECKLLAVSRSSALVQEVQCQLSTGQYCNAGGVVASKASDHAKRPGKISRVTGATTIDFASLDELVVCKDIDITVVVDILSIEGELKSGTPVAASLFCDVISAVRCHARNQIYELEGAAGALAVVNLEEMDAQSFVASCQIFCRNAEIVYQIRQHLSACVGGELLHLLNISNHDSKLKEQLQKLHSLLALAISRDNLFQAHCLSQVGDQCMSVILSHYPSGHQLFSAVGEALQQDKHSLQQVIARMQTRMMEVLDYIGDVAGHTAADHHTHGILTGHQTFASGFYELVASPAIAELYNLSDFVSTFVSNSKSILSHLKTAIASSSTGSELPQILCTLQALESISSSDSIPTFISDQYRSELQGCLADHADKVHVIETLTATLWADLAKMRLQLGSEANAPSCVKDLMSAWPSWCTMLTVPIRPDASFTNKIEEQTNQRVLEVLTVLAVHLVRIKDSILRAETLRDCYSTLKLHSSMMLMLTEIAFNEDQTLALSISNVMGKDTEINSNNNDLLRLLQSVADTVSRHLRHSAETFKQCHDAIASGSTSVSELHELALRWVDAIEDCENSKSVANEFESFLRDTCHGASAEKEFAYQDSVTYLIERWHERQNTLTELTSRRDVIDDEYQRALDNIVRKVNLLSTLRASAIANRAIHDEATSCLARFHRDSMSFVEGCLGRLSTATKMIQDESTFLDILVPRSSLYRDHSYLYKQVAVMISYLDSIRTKFVAGPIWNQQCHSSRDATALSHLKFVELGIMAGTGISNARQIVTSGLNLVENSVKATLNSSLGQDIGIHTDLIANALMDLSQFADETLFCFASIFKVCIDNILAFIKSLPRSSRILKLIFDRLIAEVDSTRQGFGESLVSNHPVFAPMQNRRRMRQFNTRPQSELIEQLKFETLHNGGASQVDITGKRQLYNDYLNQFHDEWRNLVSRGRSALANIVANARINVYQAFRNHTDSYSLVRTLLTQIFAVWTLLYSSNESSGSDDNDGDAANGAVGTDDDMNLDGKQPHRGQILSLLILFDGVIIDSENYNVSVKVINQFVQIGTGEGKSVTLAVGALVFALLGMGVDCTCYSQHLCTRDYNDFKELFKTFGVVDYIKYQTFNNQCKQFVNDKLKRFGGVAGAVNNLFVTNTLHPEAATKTNANYIRHRFQKILKSINKQFKSQEAAAGANTKPVQSIVFEMVGEFNEHCKRLQYSRRNRVLLMDEADMFFSDDFCGARFDIVNRVEHRSIAELLYVLWTNTASYPCGDVAGTLQTVMNSEEYQQCCSAFAYHGWGQLLNEAVKAMLIDRDRVITGAEGVLEAKAMPDMKIGHRVTAGGPFIDTVRARYETTFQFLKEYSDTGKLNKEALLKRSDYMSLLINCGKFSYSEIPKRYLEKGSMIGVSGTLEHMSTKQKIFMHSHYDLKQLAYIPSAFGNRDQRIKFCGNVPLSCSSFSSSTSGAGAIAGFGAGAYASASASSNPGMRLTSFGVSRGVQIVPKERKFETWTREIISRLREDKENPNGQSLERAVLVFLSDANLRQYFESEEVRWLLAAGCSGTDITVLNSETPDANRAAFIRRACQPKRVTFCTREFGRGEDFIVYNNKLMKAGGVHVLLTFLPDEISEEIQIMGRTGRQDNFGSFSIILSEDDVDFNTLQACQNINATDTSIYKSLNDRRRDNYDAICKKRFDLLPEASKLDNQSQIFITDILRNNMAGVSTYLLQQNSVHVAETNGRMNIAVGAGAESRTTVLLDATGSMRPTIDLVMKTIEQLFGIIKKIIKDEHLDCRFFIRFVVYRNYTFGPSNLLQISDWCEDPESVAAFLSPKTLICSGGEGREAIEAGLQFVNNEIERCPIKSSQVVLIGDASYNSDLKIPEHRKKYLDCFPRAPRDSWKDYPATTFKKEFARLLAFRKSPDLIPMHTCFIAPPLSRFNYVSEETKIYQAEFADIAAKSNGAYFSIIVKSPESNDVYLTEFAVAILKDIGKSTNQGDALATKYRNSIAHVVN